MDEIRCDGLPPVVREVYEHELSLVRVQLSECRAKLAKLEAKERQIQRWMGKDTGGEFMKTKVFEIKEG